MTDSDKALHDEWDEWDREGWRLVPIWGAPLSRVIERALTTDGEHHARMAPVRERGIATGEWVWEITQTTGKKVKSLGGGRAPSRDEAERALLAEFRRCYRGDHAAEWTVES